MIIFKISYYKENNKNDWRIKNDIWNDRWICSNGIKKNRIRTIKVAEDIEDSGEKQECGFSL